MRALYYLLAAFVMVWAVCQFAEMAERGALGRKKAAAAAPAPEPAGPWGSAPAGPAPKKTGSGVLVDAGGRRFETK